MQDEPTSHEVNPDLFEPTNNSNSYPLDLEELFPCHIQYNKTPEIEDDYRKEDEKRLFISTEKRETKENSSFQESVAINQTPNPIFDITKTKESIPQFIALKRNRGREPKNHENNGNPKKKTTRKFERDDILTKNQVHYFTYIILFLNCLLEHFGIKENFKQIDYTYKKRVNYDYFLELRGKKLDDIVRMDITDKIKKEKKNYNKILCEKIKKLNNPVINNFLMLDYLTFFRKYYFKSEKKIYLKNFGSENNEFISLSDNDKYKNKNITYQDKVESFSDKIYAETYIKFVEELYFSKIWKINN